MSHFADEDWVDFVRRQAAAAELRDRMQQHLDEGCGDCSRSAELWGAVGRLAAQEASCVPPEGAVRGARARFAAAGPSGFFARAARSAALLFDSSRQPLPAGVRAGGSSPQRLLYRAGQQLFKLRIERPSGSEKLSLVGQIVNEADPHAELADVAVLVLSGRTTVAGTLTNRLGEFALEFEPARGLRLSVGSPGTRPVSVRLPPAGGDRAGAGGTRGV